MPDTPDAPAPDGADEPAPDDEGSRDDQGSRGGEGAAGGDDAPSGAAQEPPTDPLSQLFQQLGGLAGGLGGAGGGLGGGSRPAGFGVPLSPAGGAGGGGLPGGLGGLGGLGGPGGLDPAALFQQLASDPAAMAQVMATVQQMLTGGGDGPVNWQVAHDLARQAAVTGGDPSPGERARTAVVEALHLADLWLDAVTDLTAPASRAAAWSRSEWVEATLPTWKRLVEPVAASVATAVADAVAEQAPPEMRAVLAGAGALMRSVGGSVFGMQLGQAVGGLAREVVSATDIGLPLTDGSVTALVPANVDAFAEGLSVPVDEVRLYLAVREAAHARLFARVPWLNAHLIGAVEQYARGIVIDTGRIEEAVRQVDPSDPQALQEALASGMFEPERTAAQEVALTRLETALALVEGWVDEVVDAAAGTHLPHAAALRESVRRRRAAGGPAEQAMTSLVGLELRPRRLRDAARLFSVITQTGGAQARDGVWAHPDLLPTSADLDAPEGYAERRLAAEAATEDVDAELERMLGGEEPPGSGPQAPAPPA